VDLIIIRGVNSVNTGFSIGGKARAIRQPVAGPVWQIAGLDGQQTAVWRYGIPISRMDRGKSKRSFWPDAEATGCINEHDAILLGPDDQTDLSIQSVLKI